MQPESKMEARYQPGYTIEQVSTSGQTYVIRRDRPQPEQATLLKVHHNQLQKAGGENKTNLPGKGRMTPEVETLRRLGRFTVRPKSLHQTRTTRIAGPGLGTTERRIPAGKDELRDEGAESTRSEGTQQENHYLDLRPNSGWLQPRVMVERLAQSEVEARGAGGKLSR